MNNLINSNNMNKTFTVKVSYTASLAEMLADAKLSHVTPDITEKNFPPALKSGESSVELSTIHIPKKMSHSELKKELSTLGYRAATLAELLALTRDHYSELTDIDRLVAPGSLWENNMVYLSGGGKSLAWCTKEWRDWYTCLVAKK